MKLQLVEMSKFGLCSLLIFCITILGWPTLNVADLVEKTSKSASFNYTADWKSLDTHPLPKWFDEAKIGIMIHWGVYTIPNCGTEWFWYRWNNSGLCGSYMEDNFNPKFTYQEFAKEFKAENFDADEWMEIIKASGAKYVIPTTKHHDGFTLWPSKYSPGWNSVDLGPHRDLIGELATATRRANLTFGLYHSLMEWFNPLNLKDKKNGFKTQEFVDKKCLPELKELVIKYEPEYIWSDGDSCMVDTNSKYWKATDFLAWLYNSSPVRDTVIVNDRWGSDTRKKHGDILTFHDRWNPGEVQKHKFENVIPLDKDSWGYRADVGAGVYFGTQNLIDELVSSVSCNGNFLLSIGPSDDGRISPIFEERLRNMGSWLKVNAEAIYNSRPWIHQKDNKTENVWYTQGKSGSVYAIVLRYPESNKIDLYSIKHLFSEKTKVSMLGYEGIIKVNYTPNERVTLEFPAVYESFNISRWGWTFKFTF